MPRPSPQPISARTLNTRWQAPAWALLLATSLAMAHAAQAQVAPSTASALSTLPIASVVAQESGESVASAAVGVSAAAAAVVVVPVALSTAGAVLVVKSIQVGARGSVFVLERTSDGARVSVQGLGSAVRAVALSVGSAMVVSIVGAGTVLSAAGEVIAFIPNAVGRALMHHERLSG